MHHLQAIAVVVHLLAAPLVLDLLVVLIAVDQRLELSHLMKHLILVLQACPVVHSPALPVHYADDRV